MRVLIPLMGCDGGKSGISRYVQELLSHLSKLPDIELILYAKPKDLVWIDLASFRGTVCTSFKNIPEVDLIHSPTHRRIPLFTNKPIITTVHDIAPALYPHKYGYLRTLYHKYVLRYLVRRARFVIVPSQYVQSSFVAWSGVEQERVVVIPHGVNRQRWFPEKGHASMHQTFYPFLLYVSRLEHPDKNHVRLIQAFELLKGRRPELKLLFVGASWNRAEEIIRRIDSSAVREDIHYLGFLPQEEIRRLYSEAEAVVMPSLYEGFGLPLLEASACGAKIACSNTTALREVGSQIGASLFDPLDPEDIAQKIEAASTTVIPSKFDWDRAAISTEEVYKRCY